MEHFATASVYPLGHPMPILLAMRCRPFCKISVFDHDPFSSTDTARFTIDHTAGFWFSEGHAVAAGKHHSFDQFVSNKN
jgi:hypothetical protein